VSSSAPQFEMLIQVRADIVRIDSKIGLLEKTFDAGLANLKAELTSEMSKQLKWMIGMMAIGFTGIVGVIALVA